MKIIVNFLFDELIINRFNLMIKVFELNFFLINNVSKKNV